MEDIQRKVRRQFAPIDAQGDHMTTPRREAINKLVDDLERFEIDWTQYLSDLEPQGVYDSMLAGKLDTLACYCRTIGWSELSETLTELLPLHGNAPAAIDRTQGYVLPEVRRLLDKTDVDSAPTPTDWFWETVHPRICALARPCFDARFFGDAVESSFKEVNDTVKRIYLQETGKEADGAGLMTSAFSPGNPTIRLNEQANESERNIQQGYMQIFAGAMTVIRNPKAHANLNPDSRKALHLICLASLLIYKIDERI